MEDHRDIFQGSVVTLWWSPSCRYPRRRSLCPPCIGLVVTRLIGAHAYLQLWSPHPFPHWAPCITAIWPREIKPLRCACLPARSGSDCDMLPQTPPRSKVTSGDDAATCQWRASLAACAPWPSPLCHDSRRSQAAASHTAHWQGPADCCLTAAFAV